MGWDLMINKCCDLLSDKDKAHYKQYINKGDVSFIEDGDKDFYKLWKGSFIGTLQFHGILYGIDGYFNHEGGGDNDSSNAWCEGPEYVSDSSGYPYFIAYNQLHAFFAWVHLRDDHMEMYLEFEVCLSLF